jgi:hypothetical protein
MSIVKYLFLSNKWRKFVWEKKKKIVLWQWFEITKAFGSQSEFFLVSHFSSKAQWTRILEKTNLARNGDSVYGGIVEIFPKTLPRLATT